MRKKKENPWSDRAASKISAVIINMQTKFSKMANDKLNTISVKRLKTGLIIFCIFSGGFSIYLAIDAIVTRPKNVNVQSIKVPQHIEQPAATFNDRVDDELYQQIQRYKHWLDSTGEQISPGMSDSIRVIEELYHSQQKQ